MLKENMYVRCPVDKDSELYPRVFACGQIMEIDEFGKTATVSIYDPFCSIDYFENLEKGKTVFSTNVLDHCSFFIGSEVFYNNNRYHVVSSYIDKNDSYYYYYLSNTSTKKIIHVCETEVVAAFNNGRIEPTQQLKRFEFQNPCWFMGRSVVSRSMGLLNNTMYGFKELAGSKIYLLPHQVNTIMRCLQSEPCRYMLADEVGMGKTIEAIAVLKLYLLNKANKKALIIVPSTLKEQWKSELLLKFNIDEGKNVNHNSVKIISTDELSQRKQIESMDFVIIDEIHRFLYDEELYLQLHDISCSAENILLLSATPVQQKKDEYLFLLRLLQPAKYDLYDVDSFSLLLDKQRRIIQRTALLLDDLEDLQELVNGCEEKQLDPHEDEECEELFEDIYEDLEQICSDLNDPKLVELFDTIEFESDDLGVYTIKVMISYVCGNYQIENNIIRNRRKILEKNDDGEQLLPIRQREVYTYSLNEEVNSAETRCYQLLTEWIGQIGDDTDVEKEIRPILEAFFSSPWAFLEYLDKNDMGSHKELYYYASQWVQYEEEIIDRIEDIMNDPGSFESYYSTRIVKVMDLLYDELFDQKVVVFTNNSKTFEVYKKVIERLFDKDEISFFGESLPLEELEVNAFKFQNNKNCRVMLCDYTGGEGRNFQCADYIIHVDLPWDANAIEQRIGRLDRLERSKDRPIVHSIVVLTDETFEQALFEFWDKGLSIFSQSLSGMEIIMREINSHIISAVKEDLKYGLFNHINSIIDTALEMKEQIRKEQNYDAAGFLFRPMYTELRKLIAYYSQNDNELFANSMTDWANLAGFRGHRIEEGVIVYRASSFLPRSAMNTQLIPPNWNAYINGSQNSFVSFVRNAYQKEQNMTVEKQAIYGTFIRSKAIENDYLRFFAPGDDVFDCIVNNAMQSTKGCSSAFAVEADVDWKGLIFTWSIAPDEKILLDNGVSLFALSPYRSFLSSEQLVVPYSIDNPEGIEDAQIVSRFNMVINNGFAKTKTVHLGKRGKEPMFLREQMSGKQNIIWFKNEYPASEWRELVNTAKVETYKAARYRFKNRSNVKGARLEMERILSSREANNELFELKDDISQLKREQELILEALKYPKMTLESVAYVWMVKTEDGH